MLIFLRLRVEPPTVCYHLYHSPKVPYILKGKEIAHFYLLFALSNFQAFPICLQIGKSHTVYCCHLVAQDICHEAGHGLSLIL